MYQYGRIRDIQHLAAQPDGHHARTVSPCSCYSSPSALEHSLRARLLATPWRDRGSTDRLGFKQLQSFSRRSIATARGLRALGHRSRFPKSPFQRDYAGRDGRKNSDALLHFWYLYLLCARCGLGDDRSMDAIASAGFRSRSATAISLDGAVDSQCDASVVSMPAKSDSVIWIPSALTFEESEQDRPPRRSRLHPFKSPEHGCRGSS